MEIFCVKESSGCIQESILLTILELDIIGLQMKFPEGFYQMEEEKSRRCYPWKGRPDIILENCDGVQVTGQTNGQEIEIFFSEPWEEKTGELVLQYYETDWEFLKRIASRRHQFLVPDPQTMGIKLSYALPKGERFIRNG